MHNALVVSVSVSLSLLLLVCSQCLVCNEIGFSNQLQINIRFVDNVDNHVH